MTRDTRELHRSPLKPKSPPPKLATPRKAETRVRLTEDERDTLDSMCAVTGVNMTDILRSTITLFRPYLSIQGCKDTAYLRTLAAAITNPNALTIQLLDDERSAIYRNESDCLDGYRDTRVIKGDD
jgi:hypothetical protein